MARHQTRPAMTPTTPAPAAAATGRRVRLSKSGWSDTTHAATRCCWSGTAHACTCAPTGCRLIAIECIARPGEVDHETLEVGCGCCVTGARRAGNGTGVRRPRPGPRHQGRAARPGQADAVHTPTAGDCPRCAR